MSNAKGMVFLSERFSKMNKLTDKEKKEKAMADFKKAMADFKEATEPFRKHPIATTLGVLWLCVFIYAVYSVWQEEWIIIAFVAGFWLMILFMGIGYCETLYDLEDQCQQKASPAEIHIHLTVDVREIDKNA